MLSVIAVTMCALLTTEQRGFGKSAQVSRKSNRRLENVCGQVRRRSEEVVGAEEDTGRGLGIS